MNKVQTLKHVVAGLAVAGLVGLGASGANAQSNPGNPATQTATADVTIGVVLTIAEVTAGGFGLNFGIVAPPNSGTETFTVDDTTGALTESNDDTAVQIIDDSDAQRARFDIDGQANRTYNLTVTDNACSDATNLDLTNLQVTGNLAGRQLDPSTADDQFDLGGDLIVSAGITENASYTCGYTVEVVYN